jgi:triosephosphate isomerase (TIM)
MRKTYIVGNWKMNQGLEEIETFFSQLSKNLPCEAWIAPQAMHLSSVKQKMPSGMEVGAQNTCDQNSGAFTGENSPASLKDLGASFTLIGHSERRALYNENDELLNNKLHIALENGLKVIFCVGETLEQREAGETQKVVDQQLIEGLKNFPLDKIQDLLVAYEPVWAIGTGKTASPQQAQEVHQAIRQTLAKVDLPAAEIPLLYGGSVKPGNVAELLSQVDIDGGLVGGASLDAKSFGDLCRNALSN